MSANNKTRKNKRLRKRLWLNTYGHSETGICWICCKELKKSEATLDHVVEKGRGGSDSMTNLALAHQKCNEERSYELSRQINEERKIKKGTMALALEKAPS